MQSRTPALGLLLVLLIGLSTPTRARAGSEAVEKYLSDEAVGVLRVDLTRIDASQTLEWIEAAINRAALPSEQKQSLLTELHIGPAPALVWEQEHLTAGGMLDVYWVFLRDHQRFMVIPVPDGLSGSQVVALFGTGRPHALINVPMASTVIGSTVLRAPSDTFDWLETRFEYRSRPDLIDALAATEDLSLQWVLTAQENPFKFEGSGPEALGPLAGWVLPLLEQCRWLSVGLNLPPEPSARLVLSPRSPAAAETVIAHLNEQVDRLLQHPQFGKSPDAVLQAIERLRPTVKGAYVIVAADSPTLNELAGGSGPALFAARTAAGLDDPSRLRIRQILVALRTQSAGSYRGFPRTLEPILSTIEAAGGEWPAGEPGFGYLRPASRLRDIEDPSKLMVIFESWEKLPERINVGFLDGRVESVSRDRFEKLLSDAQAAGSVVVTD